MLNSFVLSAGLISSLLPKTLMKILNYIGPQTDLWISVTFLQTDNFLFRAGQCNLLLTTLKPLQNISSNNCFKLFSDVLPLLNPWGMGCVFLKFYLLQWNLLHKSWRNMGHFFHYSRVWKYSFEFYFHPTGSSFHILALPPPLFSLPPIISSVAVDENLRALPRLLQISSFTGCYLSLFLHLIFFYWWSWITLRFFWVTCFTKLDQIFSNSYS